jgi:hypothetical protein
MFILKNSLISSSFSFLIDDKGSRNSSGTASVKHMIHQHPMTIYELDSSFLLPFLDTTSSGSLSSESIHLYS